MKRMFLIAVGVLVIPIAGYAGQAGGAERFEVTNLKMLRMPLADLVSALQKKDSADAKEALNAYDHVWYGVGVYVSTRDMAAYKELDGTYKTRLTTGLEKPNADAAALLPDAQAMLKRYDETIAKIEKAPPLNPLYDDVARIRLTLSNLRDIMPALNADDVDKARMSFGAFRTTADPIEAIVKARSMPAYAAIQKGMFAIQSGLLTLRPQVDLVSAGVANVMMQYDTIVAQITAEASAKK